MTEFSDAAALPGRADFDLRWRGAALWAAGAGALFLTSFPYALKYAGWVGLLVYALGFAFVIARSKRWVGAGLKPTIAVVALVVVTFGAYAALHAQAEKRLTLGMGSDQGDALRKATLGLLGGENPYQFKTVLGNPITPEPGALIFAAPFVLPGMNFGLQTIFWMAVFFVLLGTKWGRPAQTEALLVLALSLGVFQNLVTNGDYITNAAYVFVLAAGWAYSKRDARGYWLWVGILGIAILSRPVYWIIPFLFYPAVSAGHGPKRAAAALWICVGVSVALCSWCILSYYGGNPFEFPPFHVFSKYSVAPSYLVGGLLLVIPAALLLLNRLKLHADAFVDASAKFSLMICALVLGGFVVSTLRSGLLPRRSDFIYLTQALLVWPFAVFVLCCGGAVKGTPAPPRRP